MAISTKKPPIKETVGALYYCFDTPAENSTDYAGDYETDVTKSEVVKSISVTENGDSTPVYASGVTYETISDKTSIDLSVEVVAFDSADLRKMRGDTVGTNGLILSGKPSARPFFAFGKVVKLRGGNVRYVWYPKCQLTENTDDASTKEESFSEQNDTVTIKALPFDADGNIEATYDSSVKKIEGMTEDKFFAKPILKDAELVVA